MNEVEYSATHPEPFYKDEWVVDRLSLRTGGVIVDRHTQAADEIEVGYTKHHILGYQLNNFAPRQITRMDGKEHDSAVKKGYLWLKPSDCDGFWHWESTDDALILAIEPTFLRKVAAENNCRNYEHLEVKPIIDGSDRTLDYITNKFLYEMTHSEVASPLYIETLVDMLSIHLLRNYCTFPNQIEAASGGLSSGKLRLVTEYINDSLDDSLKVEQIASLVNISHYHFSRLFKQSTGLTPHQYIMEQRVIKAKHLLKNSQLSFKDIASRCGFTDRSHLGRWFKEHTGTTPKRYRDEFK